MSLHDDMNLKITEMSEPHTVLTAIFDGKLWLYSVTAKIGIVVRNAGRTAAKFKVSYGCKWEKTLDSKRRK